MKQLISIAELTLDSINQIFSTAQKRDNQQNKFDGLTCAYSFEGNSLRTRATFLKALTDLGLTAIDLPNLLKTKEEKLDLAGYLDQWIDIYVIRESNHESLRAFAASSQKPVINAMSSKGHPCEVLSDAFYIQEYFNGLNQLKFCIVGCPTNVLNSWVELCELLSLNYVRVIPDGFTESSKRSNKVTSSLDEGISQADVILTDGYPETWSNQDYQITRNKLELASNGALLIPCPPFDTTKEVSRDAINSKYFAGYQQKRCLYHVQSAIIEILLES